MGFGNRQGRMERERSFWAKVWERKLGLVVVLVIATIGAVRTGRSLLWWGQRPDPPDVPRPV